MSEMMRSCMCFPYVSKLPNLTYNRANIVIIKNAIILNIIHNIFNLRDIVLSGHMYVKWFHTSIFVIHHTYVYRYLGENSLLPQDISAHFSIQHYVIKFGSDLRHVGGFLWVLRFPSQIKLTATI
jgi:hypothetical protein